MSERLTPNQRTAAGIALLVGAGLSPIAALEYSISQQESSVVDEHQVVEETPKQQSDGTLPTRIGEAPKPESEPSPLPTPTEIPGLVTRAEAPVEVPAKVLVAPSSQPTVEAQEPEISPTPPTLPRPIHSPEPTKEPEPSEPTPSVIPSPTVETTESPEPEPTPTASPSPTPEYVSLNAENLSIPSDVAEAMRNDTVRIPGFNNCTGSIIRDEAQKPISVLSAEHCGLRGAENGRKRIMGSDDRLYSVFPGSTEVLAGDHASSLTPAGKIESLYLPAENDTTLDTALAVLEGSSLKEVLEAYEQQRLSQAERESLKTGEALYLSGWPVHQPSSPIELERQEFVMSVLGLDTSMTTNGETLDVVWAALPLNKDGTMCSFGDSGGEGKVKLDGKLRSVGALAVFVDLTGEVYSPYPGYAEDEITFFSKKFNIDPAELRKMGAICGFAYKMPNPKNGGQELQVVTSTDEIPGYKEKFSPEAIFAQVRENLADPSFEHTVIDGLVASSSGKGGGTGVANPVVWYDRPGITYVPETGAVALYWHDPLAANQIGMAYSDNMYNLTIYDRDEVSGVPILKTSGAITTTPTKGNSDAFYDANNLRFGQILDNPVVNYNLQHGLSFDPMTNQIKTFDRTYKGGK